MKKETSKKVQDEYETMRSRLQHLRVQTHLGKLELKDKLDELGSALEPAYRHATETLEELTRSGVDESVRLAKSLRAGWKELVETHRDLSKKASEEARRED